MNIELLASIPEEGHAIVRDSSVEYLLRPPYDLASRVVLLPNDLRDAVTKHGFTAENASFGSYAELIDYLEKSILGSRDRAGRPIQEKPPLAEALALAPVGVIEGFLRRVEQELIPNKGWDHAEDILINVLKARGEDEIRHAAGELWDKLSRARKPSETWQPPDARYKTKLRDVYCEISQKIKHSRCILESTP